jgi:hypothetical protein
MSNKKTISVENTTTEKPSICGWDIGIKNCSYCIIKQIDNNEIKNPETKTGEHEIYITINNNNYIIRGWDVINLLPEVERMQINKGNISLTARPKLKCTKALKQLILGDEEDTCEMVYCDKKATFVSQDIPVNSSMENNLDEYGYVSYCNKHFKDVSPENSNQYVFLNDKKLKCCYVGDDKAEKCGSSKITWIHPQHYFLTYCDKHAKAMNELFKTQVPTDTKPNECIKIIKNKNAAQLDLTMLGTALFERFDTLPDLCDVKTILLENQPVLKNPTMKSIQMFLFSYFIMKGIRVESSPCEQIRCYSANQKLDLHRLLNNDEELAKEYAEVISKLSNVYSRNKKLAVLLVEYILTTYGTGTEELLKFFKEHKKQDDLADSFLMTLHYLEVDNLKKIPVIENIKTLLKKAKVKKTSEGDGDGDGDGGEKKGRRSKKKETDTILE